MKTVALAWSLAIRRLGALAAAAGLSALVGCGARGASFIVEAPRTEGLVQTFPAPPSVVRPLIAQAASDAGFSVDERADMWVLELGMSMNASGQWARVIIEPSGSAFTTVRYVGDMKDPKDLFETPSNGAVRFFSQLNARLQAANAAKPGGAT